MFKKTLSAALLATTLISFGGVTAQAATQTCMPIGGVAQPNFVPESDGTFTVVAPLYGSVAVAAGTILNSRKTSTGLEMDMTHYFMNDKGGFMHTKDLAILTPVPGKANYYMIEVTYHIQEATTSGVLKGYKGQFQSWGLVNLKDNNGLIRYKGEICK